MVWSVKTFPYLFAYVGNNPVNFVDPFGLDSIAQDISNPATWVGIFLIVTWHYLTDNDKQDAPTYESTRGSSDPSWTADYKQHNPGRYPNGGCKPCQSDSPTWNTPGQDNCKGHQIVYNQNPETCECYPTRTHN